MRFKAASTGIHVAILVPIPLCQTVTALLAIVSASLGIDLTFHLALGRETDHFAQQIRISNLFHERSEARHRVSSVAQGDGRNPTLWKNPITTAGKLLLCISCCRSNDLNQRRTFYCMYSSAARQIGRGTNKRIFMGDIKWGILAPEEMVSLRRQQSLGLQASVRHFNDRSVPGLGNLWFPMPLVWSILAVALAEEGHSSVGPLRTANAIEAFAMRDTSDLSNPRVQGRVKLNGNKDWSFSHLSTRGTYVTQPFRMGMVQPLQELGYVTGSRFGSFRLADEGRRIMQLPAMQSWKDQLARWIKTNSKTKKIPSGLSPLVALPTDVRKNIRVRVKTASLTLPDDAARRRALIDLKTGPSEHMLEQESPPSNVSQEHWIDMRAGAALIDLRDCALDVLRAVEGKLLDRRNANESASCGVPEMKCHVEAKLNDLKIKENRLGPRIEEAKEPYSCAFLADCRGDAETLLRKLVERDGTVVRLEADRIVPGPAAGDLRADLSSEEDAGEVAGIQDFAPQLFRLWNLHCLMHELEDRKNPQSPDYPKKAPA